MSETRVVALSCGVKVSSVRRLVLSQSTRATDMHTDIHTDRLTTADTAAMLSAVLATAFLSERPSVCHMPILRQNE